MSRAEISALLFLLILFDMTVKEISAAIYNHVVTALQGYNANPAISLEQLEDEVIAERQQVLKEYILNGVINIDELYLALNCVEVDCDYMSKCCDLPVGKKALHFEIPPIMNVSGGGQVKFIGSVDRQVKYTVYTDDSYRFHEYRRRKNKAPYVYLDTTINSNGNIDGYIFGSDMVKYISVIALFADPRKLLEWDCCSGDVDKYLEMGVLSNEVIKRLSAKYLAWYKQAQTPVNYNTQQPR